jgi:hypothetical protein
LIWKIEGFTMDERKMTERGGKDRPRITATPDDHDERRRLATLLGRILADMWAGRRRDGPKEGPDTRRTDASPS